MTIGYYFVSTKDNGGVYQYSIAFLESLLKLKKHSVIVFCQSKDIPNRLIDNTQLKIVELFSDQDSTIRQGKVKEILAMISSRLSPIIFSFLYRNNLSGIVNTIQLSKNKHIIDAINKENLDLMIFPISSDISLQVKHKTMVAIHDLQHRISPIFPEVSACGRWQCREYAYSNICNKASIIIADSITGQNDIIKYYQVDKKRIFVLPYLSPSYLEVKMSQVKAKNILRRMGISGKYVFYPAKFWPHKNHLALIKAIEIVNKKSNETIKLVLSGSSNAEYSSYKEVMDYIKKRGLEDIIKYVGYVSDKQISALYKCAEALCMPTFFGPSNIPVLEAWKMKCPVIYSDIHGCKEQLGDAGILVNPKSQINISQKISILLKSPDLREKLIRRGSKRINIWTNQDFQKEISRIIDYFAKM